MPANACKIALGRCEAILDTVLNCTVTVACCKGSPPGSCCWGSYTTTFCSTPVNFLSKRYWVCPLCIDNFICSLGCHSEQLSSIKINPVLLRTCLVAAVSNYNSLLLKMILDYTRQCGDIFIIILIMIRQLFITAASVAILDSCLLKMLNVYHARYVMLHKNVQFSQIWLQR